MICKRITSVLAFIALSASTSPAQPTRLPASLWQEDLQQLSTTLAAVHPNLFTQTPRVDFDAAVADLYAAIPSLTDAQIILGLARIAALGADGHTSLGLTQPGAGFRAYPFRVRWFSDGLFVVQTAPHFRAALGKRVVGIGARSVENAFETLKPFISHENEHWAHRMSEAYLFVAELLEAAGIAPDSQSLTLTVENEDGVRS